MLHEFLTLHRAEIIARARLKVAGRMAPRPTEAELEHGVPLFLEQLADTLRHEQGTTANIGAVQLPAHLPDIIPVALSLLERAWEHAPFTWDVKLPDEFRGIEQAIAARLRKAHADAAA